LSQIKHSNYVAWSKGYQVNLPSKCKFAVVFKLHVCPTAEGGVCTALEVFGFRCGTKLENDLWAAARAAGLAPPFGDRISPPHPPPNALSKRQVGMFLLGK